jgi:hypothetical protein
VRAELGDLSVSERMRYDRTFKGYRKTELRANPPKFYDVKGLALQAPLSDWVGNGCFLIECDGVLFTKIQLKLTEFKVRYKIFECNIVIDGIGVGKVDTDVDLL